MPFPPPGGIHHPPKRVGAVTRRVLLVTLAAFGGQTKGGGERYVSELARALPSAGWDAPIVAIPKLGDARLIMADSSETIMLREFWRLARDADLIHVHQLNSTGFDLAALARIRYGTPIVLTDHGGGIRTPGRVLGRQRLRLVSAAGYVSAWSARDVDPRGTVRRAKVIWGGGDHLPKAEPFPRRYNFGFVGRMLPHKGIHILLEALPAEASLVIAGQARDRAYLAELRELAGDKDVTFMIDSADEDVARVHRSIDYLVLPSVSAYREARYTRPELLGLVALEALAAGTPVIGSDVGGLGELLRHAHQVHVEPGNAAAWRDALLHALGTTPTSAVGSKFTWNAVAHACATLYEETLADTERRS